MGRIVARVDSWVMMTAGLPEPAGKWRSRACWPSTAFDLPWMAWIWGMPSALNCGTASMNDASTRKQVSQTMRGWRLISRGMARQIPERSSRPSASWASLSTSVCENFGRNGQNAARPKMSSSAGSNVMAAKYEKAMARAATGPRSLLELSVEASKHNTPVMTVAADAVTASAEFRRACRMASHFLSLCSSASR